VSGKQWLLGDLADKVETVYDESRLERFALDINFAGAVCTLRRCRDVCRAFPKLRVRPRYFASAQVLAAHPDRFAIVENNRDISKSEAREIMRQWRAEHADTATPADQAEEADLLEDEEAETEPTPVATSTPAKAAKAKGPKKTASEEQENEWSADNREWERQVVVIVNNAKRVAAFRKRCTPEQWHRLVLDVEPSLGATVRSGSEELRELADALDEPLEKEADTLIQESRIKTTPATRPSRPVQTLA
jgi:NADH dehydrogenase/NADH:ubiquinone oxidoreductase subunit G